MLYVKLDLHRITKGGRHQPPEHHEKTNNLGPFTKVTKGIWGGNLVGIKEDGTSHEIFEATIEHGGYCDTCGYDYVEFVYRDPVQWEVKNFEIYPERKEE